LGLSLRLLALVRCLGLHGCRRHLCLMGLEVLEMLGGHLHGVIALR
jgi:hypothetical protein